MTKQEIIKELIVHYSQTVNCGYCLVENCGIDKYESQRKCEDKIKMAYINAEK